MRICPICGKNDSQAEFAGELCAGCAKSRLPQLPPARIAICARCGSIIGKAQRRKSAKLGEEVVRLLRLKRKNAHFHAESSEVEYDSSFGRIRQGVLVLKTEGICRDCSRAASQYFEAIIQLRGEAGKVGRMFEMIANRLGQTTSIPKTVELKEGLDIYVGSRNEAIAALNACQLGFLRTEKLAGERNGRRLYRTTLLVRL